METFADNATTDAPSLPGPVSLTTGPSSYWTWETADDKSTSSFLELWMTTLSPTSFAQPGGVSAEAQEICDLYKFVVSAIVSGLLCLAGGVGNTLSIWVLRHFKDASGTSFLLSTLAVCDLLVLVTIFFMKPLPSFLGYTNLWPEYFKAYSYMLVWGWPAVTVAHSLSTWVTVLVTAQRFVAVCYPHKASSLCRVSVVQKALLLTFFLVAAFDLPLFFDNYPKKVTYPDNSSWVVRTYTALGEDENYHLWYRTVAYYIFMYLVPLVILALLTFKLIRQIRKSNAFRGEMARKEKNQEDINRTLVAIVVINMFCQIWNPIRRLLETMLLSERGCGHFYFYYVELPSFFAVVNSSINFLLYCLFGSKFRRILKKKSCWRFESGLRDSSDSTAQLTSARKPGTENSQLAKTPSVSSVLETSVSMTQ